MCPCASDISPRDCCSQMDTNIRKHDIIVLTALTVKNGYSVYCFDDNFDDLLVFRPWNCYEYAKEEYHYYDESFIIEDEQ